MIWYKNHPTDKVWWLDNSTDIVGEYVFSFDKVTTFNLFSDYPKKLTKNQKEIFDGENPMWVDFFDGRKT